MWKIRETLLTVHPLVGTLTVIALNSQHVQLTGPVDYTIIPADCAFASDANYHTRHAV